MDDDNTTPHAGHQCSPGLSSAQQRRCSALNTPRAWLRALLISELLTSDRLTAAELAARMPLAACQWRRHQTRLWHVEEILRELENRCVVRRDAYRPLPYADQTLWFVDPFLVPHLSHRRPTPRLCFRRFRSGVQ